MAELNLSKPGTLEATVGYEGSVSFHLVVPNAKYTAEALAQNPSIISPADELMSPISATAAGGDKHKATADLAGRANEISAKVRERLKRGEQIPMVRAIVIAKAAAESQKPPEHLAQVTDLKLVPVANLSLTPGASVAGKTYLTVQQFKAGTKNFTIDLTSTGMTEVQLTTQPAVQISVAGGGSGNGSVKVAVTDSKVYSISIAAPFTMKKEEEGAVLSRINAHPGMFHKNPLGQPWKVIKPHYAQGESRAMQVVVAGKWARCCWGNCYGGPNPSGHCSYCHAAMAKSSQGGEKTREVWTGGKVTVRASGTGAHASVSQSVILDAQSWASEWLNGLPPSNLVHGAC